MSHSFATPWILACKAPLSMGFPKQEYWSGLPLPPPGDLPDPGIEPASPAFAGQFFTTEPPGKLHKGTLLRVLPWSKGPAWIPLGVLWLRLHLPMQGVWVQSLVGDLATKKTIQKRSNIVANSRKTLKIVHFKKNFFLIN